MCTLKSEKLGSRPDAMPLVESEIVTCPQARIPVFEKEGLTLIE